MTAEEILAKMAEAEGLYIEVGEWVVAKEDVDDEHYGMWQAGYYPNSVWKGTNYFDSLPEALACATKDGKP